MAISKYHLNHMSRSDEETQRRANVKELELKKILADTNFISALATVRIGVLGCADKRFINHHKLIFEKLLGKPVELTTFDITVEHLREEDGVVEHDITLPLPNPPYDITFGHVILKFIETSKQWSVIKNAYDALRSPGLGIFVYDWEDITTKTAKQADEYYSVPIEEYKTKLSQQNINFKNIAWSFDIGEVPIGIRGLKGGALVLLK